ncbi:glycosylated lysosomal membrane protein isoform X2 [Mauremys reevesii]|uniref:glycosylated lysosomal membrane protein isoform X2 n=1 Tax=Mauremys reevesii TaxID=260615 RepID=UPI00193EF4DF|nr:glycosylated lysosomal membrane protein isoform X2 [Mauremys reevesii]
MLRGGWLLLPGLWLLGGVSGLLGAAGGYRRKVTLQAVPGSISSSANLLHVRAVGRNDTLHYVWSSIGAPTVLLLYTQSESSALRVNWTKLLSASPAGAIWIEPPGSVVYSTAVVFTKVFEYNGANASALSKGQEEPFYPPYDLAGFSWQSVNCTVNQTALTARFQGVDPGGAFGNGTISFQVTAYEQGGRDGPLPRLLHTANSSKVEFIMDKVAPRGNSSRFMLEVVTVEEKGGRKRLQSVRSIDDEYTPTIFEMAQLVSESRNNSIGPSFFQWKTTAYGSREASRENAIRCRYRPLQTANRTLPGPSIAHAYFGEDLGRSHRIAAINISFGGEDGEVYAEKGYLSWSALLGFGTPPKDAFSPLVVAIVAVALGIPVVLLLAGGLVVLFARRKRHSQYEPIN